MCKVAASARFDGLKRAHLEAFDAVKLNDLTRSFDGIENLGYSSPPRQQNNDAGAEKKGRKTLAQVVIRAVVQHPKSLAATTKSKDFSGSDFCAAEDDVSLNLRGGVEKQMLFKNQQPISVGA